MADEQTINIPQLVVVLVLGGLAIKYFFFSASTASARPRGATIRAREQDVQRVQEMFPQLDRRLIMWDLQRNGGNVAATIERQISGRGLEQVSADSTPERSGAWGGILRREANVQVATYYFPTCYADGSCGTFNERIIDYTVKTSSAGSYPAI